MSHYYAIPLVDEADLAQARAALGTDLTRILGYFREDGAKSIVQIEEALAAGDATTMVRPAHTLKGEARQFGCQRLGDIAEAIEKTARRCVEQHGDPTGVASEIAMLRGCFIDSLAMLDHGAPQAPAFSAGTAPARTGTTRPAPIAPLTPRPRVFGRRTGP